MLSLMLDRFLYADWDEPPAEMDFELPYARAILRAAELAERLLSVQAPGGRDEWRDARSLYALAPALVNVMLNYRICVEFGLVLHATEYIDFTRKPGRVVRYLPETRKRALELYRESIDLAREAVRLDPGFPERARAFMGKLPPKLGDFVYTSRRDKYTWRASEPERVRALATALRAGEGVPALALGAAHGAIMPGLLLAEYLGCPLWFVRFSMFKRRDAEPVVSATDEAVAREAGAGGTVVVFDEDCASGTTLRELAARLGPLVPRLKTASVIRHASSAFAPDYAGKTWWD